MKTFDGAEGRSSRRKTAVGRAGSEKDWVKVGEGGGRGTGGKDDGRVKGSEIQMAGPARGVEI